MQPPPTKRKKMATKWIKKKFSPVNTECRFISDRGSAITEPLEYSVKYFPQNIFDDIGHFTNIYALQRDGVELNTTSAEIKVFTDIMIRIGFLKFPRIRMYWQEGTRIPRIADVMTSKRFFKLRAALHVTDGNAPLDLPKDKFWKVASIIDVVRSQRFALQPLAESSIDENMVS